MMLTSRKWIRRPHWDRKIQGPVRCHFQPYHVAAIVSLLFAASTPLAEAAEFEECQELLLSGKYAECVKEIDNRAADQIDEAWWLLKIDAQMALGRYSEARQDLLLAVKYQRASVHLRLAGYEVFRKNGQPEEARLALDQISSLVERLPYRYSDAAHLVTLGKTALIMGADPRQVLEVFFDRAKREQPDLREVYLASGNLALGKHDYAVAAEAFNQGLKRFPNDPDMNCGRARAYAASDPKQATLSLAAALSRNPQHVPCLLLQLEQQVDRENYSEARKTIERILAINPGHTEAWASRAALAHFANDAEGEQTYRDFAFCHWSGDPAVDHRIGATLSDHYRFAEGAAYQRRALTLDPAYLPAKVQLCQDLLRLGQDVEGWALAEEIHTTDGYDIVAFNLVNLRENLAIFRTLETPHFLVRMEAREADIYGLRVLELLERARETLCKKYGLKLKERITVEIFPDQKDFAIRTFGLPGGDGFLGVCFGKVITANSPASRAGRPSNWEAVLWHEFCHVVTLELTRNRMPRWLSEGISVYEERQADPSWGQTMNPQYREMVLGGELTPVGKLSGAFLSPKTSLHLQFAYYESSLVVEFLVERVGLDALKRLLLDLGAGVPINDALERHTGSLAGFEQAFEAFARKRAEQLAPELEWDRDQLQALSGDLAAIKALLKDRPKNFWALSAYGNQLVRDKQWAEAKLQLTRLIELYPGYTGANNPYQLLAAVHRALDEAGEERAVLERLAVLDADAVDVYERLMELSGKSEDWPAVVRQARRSLAVNPLVGQPHRWLAEAAEKQGDRAQAIESRRAQLLLDPADPAEVHFRLARLLHAAGDPAALRHILQCLEDAPRYRDALQLLLEIERGQTK